MEELLQVVQGQQLLCKSDVENKTLTRWAHLVTACL